MSPETGHHLGAKFTKKPLNHLLSVCLCVLGGWILRMILKPTFDSSHCVGVLKLYYS
jgi:hypothetical protein